MYLIYNVFELVIFCLCVYIPRATKSGRELNDIMLLFCLIALRFSFCSVLQDEEAASSRKYVV